MDRTDRMIPAKPMRGRQPTEPCAADDALVPAEVGDAVD